MIIGNGDIGTALQPLDRDDILFFASGVSNSSTTDKDVYHREMNLLGAIDPAQHVVYFSSLCVYYSDSVYAHWKRTVEKHIPGRFDSYTIVRLGNITWGTNKNTIINWFKLCYEKGVQPELQDAYRHLVTRQEFEYWIKMISPGVNDIMNIPGEFIHVKEIWRRVQNGEY